MKKYSFYLYALNSLQKVEASNFGPRSVLLHMLAAPINPADINQIQGWFKSV